MPSLSKDLRNLLSRTTLAARERAEAGVRAALENLAVHEKAPRSHMSAEHRQLRNRLWARAKGLGDTNDVSGSRRIDHLVADAAYEHWHRLLFTRFLTENNLLRTDATLGYVPVTLADCDAMVEQDPELKARSGFELACRFAGQILPEVFRNDDPVLELRLAPNDDAALKKFLDELPTEVFTADDSLGWTYQFWQAKRKQEVNDSGKKIGADEISPVTQLFTEDYMVDFLLHNTLGAWWAGKQGPIHAATEADARRSVALPERDGMPAIEWSYLRFVRDETTKTWSPAAGTFEGWPKEAKAITMLDPCMGSGHFLVFALPIIARLRMEEEGLSAQHAVAAALRDNIHGLELDPRCTQIGAFNVALTAWKLAGFQQLPAPHIACSGLAPQAKLADWVKLAGADERLQEGMKRLYGLFEQAPILGSLIDPKQSWDLLGSGYDELQPLLEKAMADDTADEAMHEMVVTARGIAAAANLLARKFTLLITNVPYLGISKHPEALLAFISRNYANAKYDLATVFLERIRGFLDIRGAMAVVTLGEWLYLGPYVEYRTHFLRQYCPISVVRLGWNAFSTPIRANPALVISKGLFEQDATFFLVDGSPNKAIEANQSTCLEGPLVAVSAAAIARNPDLRFVEEITTGAPLLSNVADARSGLHAGDLNQFFRYEWEVDKFFTTWEAIQTAVNETAKFSGREHIIRWENEQGTLAALAESVKHLNHAAQNWRAGKPFWGRKGVIVGLMGDASCSLYSGDRYDVNSSAIIPKDENVLPALWCFCESGEFSSQVRRLDNSLKLAPKTLLKIPFDLAHWQKVAAEKYPNGLPKPHTDDPTQWLFNGHPKGSDQPLHVAVARLLNYRWPRQTGSSFPDCPALGPDGLEAFADKDGIVCLPPINQEQPAAARLRQLLAAALVTFDERSLIAAAGGKANTLEEWLRDEFFEQHCKLFHHRPFVWHIWDGRKDGFHALVNYHQLDNAALQKLTYSYLGDWIRVQEEDSKPGVDKPGAAERLGTAKKLQAELANILNGEAPYDIFVRWKPLSQQAIGWHPDINDGVRLNIRPFMKAADVKQRGAGLLRWKPNVKWEKDRGSEPLREQADYPWFWCEEEPGTDPVGGKAFTGNRWNGVHLTLDKKRKAIG